MEMVRILLNKKNQRRRRHQLIRFCDALQLYIQVGYDLAYAWPETIRMLDRELALNTTLVPLKEEGMAALLERLSLEYPAPTHRIWFSTLKDLYRSGAPLADAVRAVAQSLRKEEERELEDHQRSLPTKVNALMLLFFLPATFLLLFAPLLLEMGRAFTE